MVEQKDEPLGNRIVVVGGGVAGWNAAAGLACAFGAAREIIVVGHPVSDPPVMAADPGLDIWLAILGLSPREMIVASSATFSLGIEIVDPGNPNGTAFAPLGEWAPPIKGIPMHHYWHVGGLAKKGIPIRDLMLASQAADQARVVLGNEPAEADFPRGYHIKSDGLIGLLRTHAEQKGVRFQPGTVAEVRRDSGGNIVALLLTDGSEVAGDFFIDATDDGRVIIETGARWIGDADAPRRAISGRTFEFSGPVRSSTEMVLGDDGIQMTLPIRTDQHGNLAHIFTLGDDTKSGRLEAMWVNNCVAIGIAASWIPELPIATLTAIETAMTQLMQLFPIAKASGPEAAEFNRRMNGWHDGQAIYGELLALRPHAGGPISAALQERIDIFVATGRVLSLDEDPVAPIIWAAMLIQKGFMPSIWHPMASAQLTGDIAEAVQVLPARISAMASQMPDQIEVLDSLRD